MITEKKLIKQCRRGHKKSQFELVKRYSAMLMTVCRRYARDEAMAQDILQESWIRIFTHIENYQFTGSFEAWMRKIAVRSAIQWIEKSCFKREALLIELPEKDIYRPEVLDQLDMEDLIKVIQTLPDGFRAVFNLYEVEGYSHKEVGELLDISDKTSRSQLTRAKQILRKKLSALTQKEQLACNDKNSATS